MNLRAFKNIIIFLTIGLGFLLLDIGCPIHKLTGLHCPGCGITRMFVSIVKLEFYQAFRYNPLIFIYLILFIIYLIYKIINKKNNKTVVIPNKIIYSLIVITIIFGVLRNIQPFYYLQPTVIN